MKKNPRFSVVIPTRERSYTLKYTISTVLNQSYKDFELVIMDNFSHDQTKEVVFSFQDERIKYYCSEKRLSMMDNWELALSYVNGEYVIYIGDDDALIPDCLIQCENLLKSFPDIKSVKWHNDAYIYWWPDSLVEKKQNMLFMKFYNDFSIFESHDFLAYYFEELKDSTALPSVYHGLVQTELIKGIQNKFGKYFMAAAVDIYSGIVNAYFLKQYIFSYYPLSFSGLSGKSNGTAYLFKSNKGENIREETRSEYNVKNISELFHPGLKNNGISNTVIWCFDCLLRFKDLLGLENDQRFIFNKKKILNVMTDTINMDYEGYQDAVEEIKLLARMWNINESEIYIPPMIQMERPKPGPVFDSSGNISYLVIDGNIAGFSNIYQISILINSMTSKELIYKKK